MKESSLFIPEFLELVGDLARKLGLNRVVGQIYGLLFISSEPLSLDYISEKLKISKGNVSVNIRELEKWGAVTKIWVKGSRKDYYQANMDVLNVVLNRLKMGFQIRMDEFMGKIKDMEMQLGGLKQNIKEQKEIDAFKDRVSKIKDMHEKVKGFLSLLDGK